MRAAILFFVLNLVLVVNSQYHYVSLLKRLRQVTRAIPDNISLPGKAASAVCDLEEKLVNCPATCDDTCDGDALPGCQINPCNGKVCKCRVGLVRHVDKCIIPKKCPGKCTGGPNEELRYDKCDKTCKPPLTICHKTKLNCVCKQGYVRNSKNICVLPKNCDACSGQNEVWRMDRCDNTCDNPVASKQCTNLPPTTKCFCRSTYFRNKDGKCVSKAFCSSCPGQNEEMRSLRCDDTCERTKQSTECDVLITTKCYCSPNHYRHSDGRCVLIQDCQPCRDPNEERILRFHCEDSCSNPEQSLDCANLSPQYQYYGCICKKNYLRDFYTKKCVLPGDCTKCPGDFQERRKDTCDNTCGIPNRATQVCTIANGYTPFYQCLCLPGYLRNAYFKCVLPGDCEKCSGTNEEFRNDYCDMKCDYTNISGYCYDPATYKCFCLEDHYRHSDGRCVPISDCQPCLGTDEERRLGHCDDTCDDPQASEKCIGVELKLVRCLCKKDFLRHSSGTCVPKNSC